MIACVLTAAGHASDCTGGSCGPVSSGTHNDIFCEGCHDWFEEPEVLPNGTDIAGPASWSRAQAAQWRARHNLMPPGMAAPSRETSRSDGNV